MLCRECRTCWQVTELGDADRCPACQSANVAPSFPELPELEPEIGLILESEGHQPRAENGALYHRDMLSWLRGHGVRDRYELLQWEQWFTFIGGLRSRFTEELMQPNRDKRGNEEGDDGR